MDITQGPHRRRDTKRRTTAALLALLLGVVACSSDGDGGTAGGSSTTTASTTTTLAVPEEPTGVIAIGHSGVTGFNADPDQPNRSALEFSWATGDSPDVDSIYSRLVAVDARHEGHVSNRAANGSTVDELLTQWHRAVGEVPNPALVLIMSIDNDLRCDGTDGDNVAPIGESYTALLDEIVAAAPETHIVLLGSPNRPATYVDALIAQDDALSPDDSICDLFTEDGAANPEGIATLTDIIEAYEAEMDRVCATYAQCTSAIAAAVAAPIGPGSIAEDLQHSSIQGHRELAEAIWPVVEEALGL
jgi:lysophospholipase L1-like esterase